MVSAIPFPFLWTLPLFVSTFTHQELRDARTMQKPFWPKTRLAEIEFSNDTLRFGSTELLAFLPSLQSESENGEGIDNRCVEALRESVRLYEEVIRNITSQNLTSLSDRELDVVTSFGAWGSDVKYALWTLDHWNWVSNDMQCKLARFYSKRDGTQKTQYCAYEVETGEDVRRNLVVGYCVPDSCDSRETAIIGRRLSESVPRYWTELVPKGTTDAKVSVDCVPSYQTATWYTRPQSWIMIVALIVLTALTVLASILRVWRKRENQSEALGVFVRAFSAQSGVEKLCYVSGRAVGSMNGLKTLTMLFMMFCHVFLVRQAFDIDLDQTREAFRHHVLGAIMYNGTYSVGTFFLLGAALHMLITLSKFEESRNKRFSPVPWLCAVVNRYLRLVPLLMFSTALLTEILPYFNFPLWTYIDTARRCPKDYWRQLLLVQNLQKINLCATWTWYLAVDFQLFLLNLPLVCLIQHKPRIGLALLAVLLPASCVIKAWLILHYDYPPNLMLLVPIAGYDENFSRYSFEIYMRPQGWWSSYLVGLAVGYALFEFDRKGDGDGRRDIPAKVYWPVSALAAALILWAVFGIHGVANGFKNPVYDAAYSGLISAAWAAGWGWVVFACQRSPRAKYLNFVLSSRPMVFLSNLTYSCYLIHMPLVFGVIYTYAVGMGGRPRIRFDRIELSIIVLLVMVVSWAAAFVFNLLVEGPAANLQSVCMKAIFDKLLSRRPSADGKTDEATGAEEAKRLFGSGKRRKGKENGTEAEEREMEEFSSASLTRPSERYPVRRI